MAITLVRTAYSNNLKNAMDMSSRPLRRGRPADRAGPHPAAPPRLDPRRDGARCGASSAAEHRAGRRLHPERPVRGRHPPARLLHLQADLRGRPPRRAGPRASATSSTSAARPRAATAATPPRSSRRGSASRRSGCIERGEPVEALFELIERNVRVPRQVLGDVRAQVAACLTGERGYLKLAEQYGRRRFAACYARRCSTRPSGWRATRSARCPTAATASPTGSTTTASTPTRSRSR